MVHQAIRLSRENNRSFFAFFCCAFVVLKIANTKSKNKKRLRISLDDLDTLSYFCRISFAKKYNLYRKLNKITHKRITLAGFACFYPSRISFFKTCVAFDLNAKIVPA